MFSKPWVCQGLLKIPNPAHTLVPLLGHDWLQSPLMRAIGTRAVVLNLFSTTPPLVLVLRFTPP